MTKDEEDFLEGLAELTRRTGIEIAACGCCNSPWLSPVKSRKGHYKTGRSYTLAGDANDDTPCEVTWVEDEE